MTQQQFDNEMHKLNIEQDKANEPFNVKLIELNNKRNEMRIKIMEMQLEFQKIGKEIFDLNNEKKLMNIHYHSLKHQLCIDNPKESIEDVPAEENEAE